MCWMLLSLLTMTSATVQPAMPNPTPQPLLLTHADGPWVWKSTRFELLNGGPYLGDGMPLGADGSMQLYESADPPRPNLGDDAVPSRSRFPLDVPAAPAAPPSTGPIFPARPSVLPHPSFRPSPRLPRPSFRLSPSLPPSVLPSFPSLLPATSPRLYI